MCTQKEESEINREVSSLISDSLQLHSCALAQMNVKSREVAILSKISWADGPAASWKP